MMLIGWVIVAMVLFSRDVHSDSPTRKGVALITAMLWPARLVLWLCAAPTPAERFLLDRTI